MQDTPDWLHNRALFYSPCCAGWQERCVQEVAAPWHASLRGYTHDQALPHCSEVTSMEAALHSQGIQVHCSNIYCRMYVKRASRGEGTSVRTHFLGDTKVMSMLSLQRAHAHVSIPDCLTCKDSQSACENASEAQVPVSL